MVSWRPIALVLALALPACGSTSADSSAELEPQRREELAKHWRLYLANDPKWPEAREQWISGSEVERELLLDNLLIELLRDDAASRGSGTSARSARARRELTWFGGDGVEYLIEAMRALVERERVDAVALDRIGYALAELQATKELAALAAPAEQGGSREPSERPEREMRLRVAATRSLALIDDPEAVRALASRLCDDPSWEVRAAAAEGLRKRVQHVEARAALVQALSDEDGFVRAQAVRIVLLGLKPEEESGEFERVLFFLLEDPAPAARAAAAASLALFTYDPRVEAALVRALADRDRAVVQAAAQALVNQRTLRVQRALIDALERAKHAREEALVSELLAVLSANVGERPTDIWNPAGWRKLVETRARPPKEE